ncbi:NAD kinase [Leptobacterium flavescens]|uniref:NAD kinase n=1 Tax=Leptobacterium flavescens TaxID=472055 RepID=A0A6P0UJJ5_9FLAO|nr:NAD kinase [Leptobacterium flavescens]NER12580.1 NAD kinase [Leptobacterium flavescens]
MKIGIYGQFYQAGSDEYVKTLLDELNKYRIDVYFEEHYLAMIKEEMPLNKTYQTFTSYEDLDSSFDLFFSIGGDGTMLRTILYIRSLGIPVLGINTGRLGFLATIQKEEITEAVKSIVNKEYEVIERSLLQVQTYPRVSELNELNFALNEIAVSRKNTTSMITVSTYLNGEYLTSYWADGLIAATPTGSTGYSLSCGGPVITPDTSSVVLTPIAPHNLNARPLVIPDDTIIKLRVSGREDRYLVSLDSRIATVTNETELTIKKAPFTIRMVELKSESFFKTLRKKLLWGEDKRN